MTDQEIEAAVNELIEKFNRLQPASRSREALETLKGMAEDMIRAIQEDEARDD